MKNPIILGTYENIALFKTLGFEIIIVNSAEQTKMQLEKLLSENVNSIFVQEDFFDKEFYHFKEKFQTLTTIPFA